MSESLNNTMETVSFRRFLSYIYAYEDDTKLRNVGFAKVEVRAQRVRFQVTVNGLMQKGGRPLEVCLVDGNMRRIPVGQMQLQNGRGEYRGSSSMDNMWESGISFSQVYGLCLQGAGSRRHYYMTLWREPRPFLRAAEAGSGYRTKESTRENAERSIKQSMEERTQESMEQSTQENAQENVGESMEAAECRAAAVKTGRNEREVAAAEVNAEIAGRAAIAAEMNVENDERTTAAAEMKVETDERGVIVAKMNTETAGNPAVVSGGEETTYRSGVTAAQVKTETDEYEVIAAQVKTENDEREVIAAQVKTETDEREVTAAEIKKETAKETTKETAIADTSGNDVAAVQQDLEAASELLKQQSVMAPARTQIVNKRSGRRGKEDKRMELWKKFCSHYPHVDIRPIYVDDRGIESGLFDKGRICEVIRIRPNDIGRLPKNNWILAHNSFLQNAYNHSRHLILFRVESMENTENTEGSRWFIGLPGEKNEQESLVAEVFGFKKYLKCRNGGFWYTEIFMGAY